MMNKNQKYELLFIKFLWIIIIAYAVKILVLDIISGSKSNYLNIYQDVGYILLMIIVKEKTNRERVESDKKNKHLIDELEDKYAQIEQVQKEIQENYEKSKEANLKLEQSNQKLSSNIAEFFTLQQISYAISSILDVEVLLRHVNDIIIGVMGVSNSTIILYDEEEKRLKVNTTSIRNQEEINNLNQNINVPVILEVLNKKKAIIENNVDYKVYSFTQGRNTNSFICIPLISKVQKLGMVLVEHVIVDAFQDEHLRLLDIIAQQVSIAIENATLYKKMHILASRDGLTNVYNRLFFHEKFNQEFEQAKSQGHVLSIAIFDIDYFKKFNDTYGHLFGDIVLKNVAKLVKTNLKDGEIIARFGGEEFIIIFPKTQIDDAFEKVESLRSQIEKMQIKDGVVSAKVNVSFGVSSYPECGDTESELLRSADDALYEAKRSGRNCTKKFKSSSSIKQDEINLA